MGLLDKIRRKKEETVEKVKEQTTPQPTPPTNAGPPPGRRIKRYILLKENQSMNRDFKLLLPRYFFIL